VELPVELARSELYKSLEHFMDLCKHHTGIESFELLADILQI
jgi:hypothetical protein